MTLSSSILIYQVWVVSSEIAEIQDYVMYQVIYVIVEHRF